MWRRSVCSIYDAFAVSTTPARPQLLRWYRCRSLVRRRLWTYVRYMTYRHAQMNGTTVEAQLNEVAVSTCLFVADQEGSIFLGVSP